MLLKLGGAMYRHRKVVLALWGLVLLGALPIAPRVFRTLNAGGFTSPDLEAFKATALLADRFGENAASLYLIYDDPTGLLSADDPAFNAAVAASLEDVRRLPQVERVVTGDDNPRQVAPDRRAQYAPIMLPAPARDVSPALPPPQPSLRPPPPPPP